MIEIKEKLSTFLDLFKIIENLCEETNISFKKEKIVVRAVHPSNHCLILISINPSLFESYEVQEDITYTLNISALNKILKKFKKGVSITAQQDYLIFKNEKMEYQLNYYVGNEDEREMPQISPTSKWVLDSKDFFSNITDAKEFSEVIKIESSDALQLKTKANMVNGQILQSATKVESTDCHNYYDLTYIEKIIPLQNIFESLKFGFGPEIPCIIKNSNDDVSFQFLLACRLEEQQDD